MNQLIPHLGLVADEDEFQFLEFLDVPQYPTTSAMRAGLSMISNFIQYGKGDPLEGFMEVPMEIGEIVHSAYFAGWSEDQEVHVSHKPVAPNREMLYAFMSLACPDEFLIEVHRALADDGNGNSFAETDVISKGHDAYDELRRSLTSAGYLTPELSDEFVKDLSGFRGGFATGQFDQLDKENADLGWYSSAGYNLLLGMSNANLLRYWEDFPSLPFAFAYSEHGNMTGTGMGFVARSPGLFVSQQVWGSGGRAEPWNECTASFNTHISKLLSDSSRGGAAMVIFSDFRQHAYVVSTVPESWDEYAPMSAVLGPLPEGFGIVGVWRGHDDRHYKPRSFNEIIDSSWSEKISACARYLRDCLLSMRSEQEAL